MEKLASVIIRWLGANKIFAIPRGYVAKLLTNYYDHKGLTLVSVDGDGRRTPGALALILQNRKERTLFLSSAEACQLYTIAKSSEKIPGDIAEVGVYRGGSAKLICGATKKPAHLFDTFEGLPHLSSGDEVGQFHEGEYSAHMESVQNYLKAYPNALFYKGLFPSTGGPIKDKKFCFVHLDVDLYESTLNCLEFFYSRMSRGGAIVSHDYFASKGVKKAFDKFFSDKAEMVIELTACDQCLVIKV